MQDIEFTVENNKLWMLQTRNGKRTAKAGIKIAVDMVKFYSGPNDTGITIFEVIEEKINEKYEGQKIFDDENTSAIFFVESIPIFLEAKNEFTHQVIFTFDAENNQQLVYSWFVNIENGEISPIDGDTKNIQQTVDYYD